MEATMMNESMYVNMIGVRRITAEWLVAKC
jgi:hypothetical protein